MALNEMQLNEVVDKIRTALKEDRKSNPFNRKKEDEEHYPEYSEIYEYCVELMEEIKIHAIKGEFPHELFALRSPNENEVEQKYRKDTYKQITLPVFIDYMSVQSRAFNDSNWSVEYAEQDSVYNGYTFQQYVEEGIRTYGSLESFIFNVLLTKKAIDANGMLVIKPTDLQVNEEGVINPDALVDPIPVYCPSSRVAYVNDKYVVLQSLEKSVVLYGNMEKKLGYVYEVYDDTSIYIIKQVGKYLDYEFEVIKWFDHNIGYIPCKRLLGIPRLIGEDLIYQSPFSFVTDNLDLAILDSSNLAISKSRTAFPVPVAYGQICEFEDGQGNRCMDGTIKSMEGSSSCPSCNGTGLKTRFNPMTGILLKPPTIGDDGDKDMSQQPLQYVSPSTEILTFLDEQIDKHISRAREILHIPDADAPVQGNEGTTATGSNNKLKALYAFLKPISDQVFELYEFSLNTIGIMRYGTSFEKPKVNRPVNFDFKTESDYLADIDNAINAKLPPMVLHTILYRYLNTYYYNETKSAKVLNLIVSVDRLFGLTMDDINLKVARSLAANWEVILHDSAITLVGELIEEDDKFLDKDIAEQQTMLIDKAKVRAEETNTQKQSLVNTIVGQ